MPFIPRSVFSLLLPMAVGLALLPAILPNEFFFGVAIIAMLNAAVCVNLNLFVGAAGQISLGHAAFFAIGAYAVAILPMDHNVPGLLATAIGAAVAGLLAYVVGRPILRLKGHYLAMATLGVGIIIFLVLNQEITTTGGPDGKAVLPLTAFGYDIVGDRIWYGVAAVFLLLVMWTALNVLETGYGRSLRALHASEAGAVSIGIDVAREKLHVFVLSASTASIAGSFYAFYVGFVTPSEAGFLKSVELIVMIVIGGLGSVFGAVVGALIITILPQVLTGFHDYEQLAFGVLLMVVAVGLRKGIVPTIAARVLQRVAS